MFNLFGNKKKQEQESLEKEQKRFEGSAEKFLSSLHPNIREVFAKDYDALESYIQKRDRAVPIGILILMSQVLHLTEHLATLEKNLSGTVEEDNLETDPTEVW